MENKEIIEGNKLIAEFMEVKNVREYTLNEKHKCLIISDDDGFIEYVEGINFLSYNDSWNSLMPVVEKIEKLGFDSRIHGNNSDDGYLCDFLESNTNNEISCFVTWQDSGGTKIQATYKAVVKFIKWYNENKNNNNGK